MRWIAIFVWVAAVPYGLAQDHPEKPILVLNAAGHTDGAPRVLFTPDGQQILTISRDKTIGVWDAARGDLLRILRPPIAAGRAGMLYAAALSREGKTLAVAGVGVNEAAPGIYLISLDTGRIERVLTGHTGTIVDLVFSPEGNLLASGGEDRTAIIWNTETGKAEQTLQGHTNHIYNLAFAPDGLQLVTASFDATARMWSLKTGKTEHILRDSFDDGRTYRVRSVAWSPDGKTVATGSADRCIRLWNTDGSKRSRLGPMGGSVQSLTFAGDSGALLFTTDTSAHPAAIIDLKSAKERVRFAGHRYGLFRGALSPTEKLAATTGFHGEEIFLWKASDGSLVHRLSGRSRTVWSAGWGPDGKTVAWGNTGKDSFNNALNPLERSFLPSDLEFGAAESLAKNDGFVRSRIESGSLKLLRAKGEDAVLVNEGEKTLAKLKFAVEPPKCYTFLSDKFVAVGTITGLYLCNARSGNRVRQFIGHTGDLRAVAPSPDGRYLLSASSDQTLRILDPSRSEPLLSFFFAGDEWIAWTSEGYYAASAGGEKLMGWHVNNGPDKMATFYPAAQFRKSLYRPDVIKRLLEAGSLEKALKLADAARPRATPLAEVSQLLPPKVAITSPERSGTRLIKGDLEVKASAVSVGEHPVTAMRLLVDGRPYQGEASLKRVGEPHVGEASQSWSLQLMSGRHLLAIQAESSVSAGLSEVVEVTVAGKAAEQEELPSLYVLSIGINAYPETLALRFAATDAQAISDTIEEKAKPLFRQIRKRTLLDEAATRKGILDGFLWLRKEMTQRDVAVIFFAGHGAKDNEGSLYLVPSDVDPENLLATGVGGDQVKKAIAALPGRILLMLDACHAGAVGGDRRAAPVALTDDLVRDLATDDYGVIVMCAAMSREFSRESRTLRHGYFTQAVVEGLSGKANNMDGAIYLHHLDAYVTDRVKELSGGLQHPVTAKPTSIRSFPLTKP